MLTGENGILNRATTAKQTNEEKQAEEELKLGISALAIDYRKNTTNADSFRDYVMNNKQSLANAMGINQNELTMEPETYTVTYKGQMYIVEADGRLSSYRLIELTGFNIKETTLSIQEGRTEKLTIENRTPNGANEGIIWTSSDPTIASVDANGLVTGVKQSATTVTITATSKSGNATSSTSCVVTVTEAVSEIEEGINAYRYGDYVHYNIDLGIDGNFDGVDDGVDDDWRIFYEDSKNIYLIAAYSAREINEYMQGAIANIGAEYHNGRVFWSKEDAFMSYKNENDLEPSVSGNLSGIMNSELKGTKYLIGRGSLSFWNKLYPTSTWIKAKQTDSLLDSRSWSTFAGGLPDGLEGTCFAFGGPTIAIWAESWNAKEKLKNDDEQKIIYYYNRPQDNTGYYVSMEFQKPYYDVLELANSDSVIQESLYFPQNNNNSYTQWYWIASPTAKSGGNYSCLKASQIASNTTNGRIYSGSAGHSLAYQDNCGVRPIVCLPSTVTISKLDNSSVWQIVEKSAN